jgi:hypothetical protein
MERAFSTLGVQQPYQYLVDDVVSSPAYAAAAPAEQARLLAAANQQVRQNYIDYADLLRTADLQFANTGTGLYDTNLWTNALRYGRGQAKVQANADELLQQLTQRAEPVPSGSVRGGVNVALMRAAEDLGFDPDNFRRTWQNLTGSDPTNYSINERYINALNARDAEALLYPQALVKVRPPARRPLSRCDMVLRHHTYQSTFLLL